MRKLESTLAKLETLVNEIRSTRDEIVARADATRNTRDRAEAAYIASLTVDAAGAYVEAIEGQCDQLANDCLFEVRSIANEARRINFRARLVKIA